MHKVVLFIFLHKCIKFASIQVSRTIQNNVSQEAHFIKTKYKYIYLFLYLYINEIFQKQDS